MIKHKKLFAILFAFCSLFSSMRFASAVFDVEHHAVTPHDHHRGLNTHDPDGVRHAHLSKARENTRRSIHSKKNFLEEQVRISHEQQILHFTCEKIFESKSHSIILTAHLRAPPTTLS